jgi:DivIVA domain-containing protein
MLSFVAFVVGVLVVGALLFLGASLLLGRGETQPPADLDRSPVALPDDRPVTADDVRALQFTVTARGYRMTEVDWLLDQFALVLDERDAEIAALRARLHPAAGAPSKEGQEPARDDDRRVPDGLAPDDTASDHASPDDTAPGDTAADDTSARDAAAGDEEGPHA